MQVWDEEERPLGPGKENIGEFVLRGHAVTKGYYKNSEGTAEAITHGWLRTGDLGYQDEEGFYFIVDRRRTSLSAAGTTSTRGRSRMSWINTPRSATLPS